MNLTMIIGNLTKAPEQVQGQKLAKLTLAVNENYTKEDGTRPVTYFNVLCWNSLSEIVTKYLTKGSKIAVVGRTQNRVYEASDGTKKYVSEIIATDIEFISTPKKEQTEKTEQTKMQPITDEDLPF